MTYREILRALEDCEQALRANERWRQQFFVVRGRGVIMPQKAYLTVAEVSSLIGMRRKAVYIEIKSGRFEARKFESRWLIKTDSITRVE